MVFDGGCVVIRGDNVTRDHVQRVRDYAEMAGLTSLVEICDGAETELDLAYWENGGRWVDTANLDVIADVINADEEAEDTRGMWERVYALVVKLEGERVDAQARRAS